MNINISDRNRRNLIRKLARDASLTSLQIALEEIVAWADEETVNVLADAIGEVLEGPEKSSYYDVYNRKYTKPDPDTCDLRKCPTCFWRFICEAEASYKLIQETHSAIAKLRAATRKQRSSRDTKQTWKVMSSVANQDKGESEAAGRRLSSPSEVREKMVLRYPSVYPEQAKRLQEKKDFQFMRKTAHDTLKKMKKETV